MTLQPQDVQDYVKAGKAAGTTREEVRGMDMVGRTAYDICEDIEGRIRARGAQCAFPVNVSINEVAAHYTAEPGDETTVAEGDTVKIDLGAHVNGWIADTAVTVSHDPQYDGLVRAAEEALGGAMAQARDGAKSRDIGRTIEGVIKRHGYTPIANLSGHSLGRYVIHGGRSIPNTWSIGSFGLSSNSAYACEPFVTTRDGLGFVREGKTRNIFALVSRKKTKNPEADGLLEFIWDSFNTLPFALRWIVDGYDGGRGEAGVRELLDVLVAKKAVQSYPVLVEAGGKRVAQAEHTFIPNEDGALVTTSA